MPQHPMYGILIRTHLIVERLKLNPQMTFMQSWFVAKVYYHKTYSSKISYGITTTELSFREI